MSESSPHAWRHAGLLRPPAILLLLVPLFFWKLAFTNLVLARGDTLLYFYPYWDYRAQALLAGRLPLWQPILFMGAPFLANSQAGVLYPFNWPLALLDAPTAVKLSTVFHLMLAAGGSYVFSRRALRQSTLAALLSAALFGLGGYLTAQVEHVNQLQGLAWLPWLLFTTHTLVRRNTTQAPDQGNRLIASLSPAILCAFIVALQILAGHTQSAFISLASALGYALTLSFLHRRLLPGTTAVRALVAPPLLLLLAAGLAVLVAAAQLFPTLELSGQSLRGGGLPLREALSFSLDPRLLGRALLPGFSRTLFSEFTAYVGIVGLALAVAGLRRTPVRMALAVLAAVGIFFALGGYNPLYALLASMPPFNLFRVPARWLILIAFGLSQLAGSGLDDLGAASNRRKVAMLLAPLLLIAAVPLANSLIVAGETGPLGPPAMSDLLGWLFATVLMGVLIWLPGLRPWRASALAALAIVELAAAGWVLPYNHPTAPDVVTSVRPAMTQLLAAQSLPPPVASGDSSLVASSSLVTTVASLVAAPTADPRFSLQAPARFLSMSALRFDPGDLAELRAALDPQLPQDAVYDYIVATKHQEVQSPNLPLAWDLPAVDGYDGGILPLRYYAAFTQLFTGAVSSDGRLRENLAAAPDPRLLSLVNARYLISDKVGDAWVDGIFYDLQFTLTLAAGESAQIARVPRFQATALGFVADAYSGRVKFSYDDGTQAEFRITGNRVRLDTPATPVAITLNGPMVLHGLSLVDERSGAFQSLTLGPYRLAHSGDVKVYENLAVLPRAFVASQAIVLSDVDAQTALARPEFDPATTITLAEPAAPAGSGTLAASRPATITTYSPEFVSLTADGPGHLLLTDAYYPGWTATLDGAPISILRADIMFRAVALPPGPHVIEFRYDPLSVRIGLWISGATLLALSLFLLMQRRQTTPYC
jgi:hypothetical protein